MAVTCAVTIIINIKYFHERQEMSEREKERLKVYTCFDYVNIKGIVHPKIQILS